MPLRWKTICYKKLQKTISKNQFTTLNTVVHSVAISSTVLTFSSTTYTITPSKMDPLFKANRQNFYKTPSFYRHRNRVRALVDNLTGSFCVPPHRQGFAYTEVGEERWLSSYLILSILAYLVASRTPPGLPLHRSLGRALVHNLQGNFRLPHKLPGHSQGFAYTEVGGKR